MYKTYLALDSGNSDTVFTNDATLDSSVKTLEDTETAITYEDPNSGSNMDSDASEDEQVAQEDKFSRSKSSSASKFTVYATTGINVRSKPSTSSSKIGLLSKGSAVKATALNNSWYTIIYNGKTGYISAQYASKTKPATISTSTVVYTTSALKNNWYTTTYNGRTGYVSAQYVTSQKHCTAVYWLSVCLGVAMGRMHMTVLDSQKCSMRRWERPSLEHLMLSILTAKKYQNLT